MRKLYRAIKQVGWILLIPSVIVASSMLAVWLEVEMNRNRRK